MWYPLTVTVAPAAEPVTVAEAKAQCRIDGSDEDAQIGALIAAAREYVESYTGTALVTRTVTVKCDHFADFKMVPALPLRSVSSIAYVDEAGATHTLSADVYEVRSDGLEASIVLKPEKAWPTIQKGSRITVTASIGYSPVPPSVKHAILLILGDWYRSREDTTIGVGITQTPPLPHGVAALLANFRRFAF